MTHKIGWFFLIVSLFIVGAIIFGEKNTLSAFFSEASYSQAAEIKAGDSAQQKTFFQDFYEYWENDLFGNSKRHYSVKEQAAYLAAAVFMISATIMCLILLLVFINAQFRKFEKNDT